MATELAKAYVQIIPSARGIKGAIQKELGNEPQAAGKSAGMNLGSSLVKSFTGVIAAAGIGKAIASSISEGAALQQSVGGIETLFKESAGTVIKNAEIAYKTAGMSANKYMENTTSFAASLISSLGGNTKEAADLANTAMVDMSDNANKMGTDMESITQTYQSLARGNYAMLDNLKLGYGGTKSEMKRLMADAEKLTGEHYTVGDFADTVKAIHAVQKSLDITGTTAKEAATTLSGSFSMMKSSFLNVLGALSSNEIDLVPQLQGLGESVSTFLFGNLIPMIGRVFSNIPVVIGTMIEGAGPAIKKGLKQAFPQGGELVDSISGGISNAIRLVLFTVQDIGTAIKQFFKGFKDSGAVKALADAFREVTKAGLDLSEKLEGFIPWESIGKAAGNIVKSLADIIKKLAEFSQKIDAKTWKTLAASAAGVFAAFKTGQGVIAAYSKYQKLKMTATYLWDISRALGGIAKGSPAAKSALSFLTGGGKATGVLTGVASGLGKIGGLAKSALGAIGGIFGGGAFLGGGIVTAIGAAVAGLTWFFTQTKTGQKMWSSFVDWLKGVWNAIPGFFKGIWDGIVGVFNGAIDAIKGAWEGFSQFMSPIVEAVKGIWNGISEFFVGLWNGIVSTAQSIWGTITTALAPIIESFKGMWNSMIEFFSTLWDTITTVAGVAWDGIKAVITGAWDAVKAIWNGAGEFFSGLWNGITETATTVWNGLAPIIQPVLDGLVLIVQTAMGILKGAWDIAWNGISATVSAVWGIIQPIVQAGIDIVKGFIDAGMSIIKTIWDTVWNAISAVVKGIWDTISSIIQGAFNVIKGIFDTATALLKGDWEGAWNSIKGIAESIWNAITGVVSAAWNTLTGLVSGAVDGVKNIISTGWNFMKDTVSRIGNALKDAFVNSLNAMKGLVGGIVDGVKGLLNGLKNIDLGKAAKAIMDGFVNGLKGAWEAGKNFVGGIGSWIAKHKGPISYDRRLLIPAGKAIMGGLNGSMISSFREVQKTVLGMAGAIAEPFNSTALNTDLKATQTIDVSQSVQDATASMTVSTNQTQTNILDRLGSLEQLLIELVNKDQALYMDGEKIAINSYQRQAAIMAREGL